MNPHQLSEYLSAKVNPDRFHEVTICENPNIEGLQIVGCLQKKSLNIHRAICLVTVSGTASDIEESLIKLREFVHKSLKARFWRGLGLGLIVYGSDPIDEAVLTNVVDYAAKRTTIIQWLASVSIANNSVTAAHTWMNVSISYILEHVFEAFQIHETERNLLIVQPKGFYKTLFSLNGYKQES